MATKISHKELLPDFTKSIANAKALLLVIQNIETLLKASLKTSQQILSTKGNKTEYENIKRTTITTPKIIKNQTIQCQKFIAKLRVDE